MVVVPFPKPEPTETELAIEGLLRQARDRDLVGIAWVALYRDDDHDFGCAGEVLSRPIFTRGLLVELILKLMNDLERRPPRPTA